MTHPLPIRKVYVEESLGDNPFVRNIQDRARRLQVSLEMVRDVAEIESAYQKKGLFTEKEVLLVHRYKGSFLSTCPGSDGMICCNYFVINTGIGCVYDCHYCFLQTFMNTPLITQYGNLEDLFREVEHKVKGRKFQYRIGTGEYTDSLALDKLTGLSSYLVPYFARNLGNALLELKTKSSEVEELLELDHGGKTVVSFSLNPPRIIRAIEDGTASLEERLSAARLVRDAGYRLAFHFDPIIITGDGDESEYLELIDLLFSNIVPEDISYVSMGGFRYSPGLKEIVQGRFPDDRITTTGEMIQGSDGKYRYFKTIRERYYSAIKKKVESVDPSLFLYLCMESRPMWKKIYGYTPDSPGTLEKGFQRASINEPAQTHITAHEDF